MSKTVTAGVAILRHSSCGSNDDCMGKPDSAQTSDSELPPFGPPVRQSVRCLLSEQEGERFEWRSGLPGRAHPCPSSTGVSLSPFHGRQHGIPLHLLSFSIFTCASMSFLQRTPILFFYRGPFPFSGIDTLWRGGLFPPSMPSTWMASHSILKPWKQLLC